MTTATLSKSAVRAPGATSQAFPCTIDDVRDLPTLPVWHDAKPSAAGLLRMSRTPAYAAATNGDLPTIRVGGKVHVVTAELLRMLAVD